MQLIPKIGVLAIVVFFHLEFQYTKEIRTVVTVISVISVISSLSVLIKLISVT